jgi:hypothetical protein
MRVRSAALSLASHVTKFSNTNALSSTSLYLFRHGGSTSTDRTAMRTLMVMIVMKEVGDNDESKRSVSGGQTELQPTIREGIFDFLEK